MLRTIDRTKLYTQIVDQILEGIRSGTFPPGTALPPERTIAEQLGVSRGSVREAIRVLEHAGVLDVRIGSGTYVTEAGLSKRAILRARTNLLGEVSPLDVLMARKAIEPVCAEQAAANWFQRDLDLLNSRIVEHAELIEKYVEGTAESVENTKDDHRHPLRADYDFHIGIASAAHNAVLVTLVESLAEPLLGPHSKEILVRAGYERDLDDHRAILAAIEQRDGARAAAAMRDHLDWVETHVMTEVD